MTIVCLVEGLVSINAIREGVKNHLRMFKGLPEWVSESRFARMLFVQ